MEKGTIDLSDWDFETGGSVRIRGEAEFYWNRLIAPEDFTEDVYREKTGYINIPLRWENLKAR